MARTRMLGWVRRTHGPLWAGVSVVLFAALLGSASVHDHADDAPGTTEIHCLAVAGPAVLGPSPADAELRSSPPARLEETEHAPRLRAASVRSSDRARAPPVGTALYG